MISELGKAFFVHEDILTPGDRRLKSDSLMTALKKDKEIDLTVTGRKSGKRLPRPVWFVMKETELLLLPVTGTDSQWYKNVLRNPQVEIRAGTKNLQWQAACDNRKKTS